MPFVPAENCVACEMIFTRAGVFMENVLNFKFDHAVIQADMETLANDLRLWWNEDIRTNVGTDTFLSKIIVRNLTTENSMAIEYASGLPSPGTGGQVGLPSNVTVAIKLNTPYRGRSFRGRIYHVGLRPGLVDGSYLTAAGLTQLQTSYGSLITAGTFTDGQLVVLSRFANNEARLSAVATPVSAISINATLDSQRRRLPERGA